jgi:hypothetical protein
MVNNYFGLFKMIKAAITPGTQPAKVKRNTIIIDPQPLPITERGGNITARMTRHKLIVICF